MSAATPAARRRRPPPLARTVTAAVAAVALAAQCAAADGALPSCASVGGSWVDDPAVETTQAGLSWQYDVPCAQAVGSPDDARRKLAGHTLWFVGDSTMRGMMNDVALWLAGCPPRPLKRQLLRRRALQVGDTGITCNLVATKSWSHWFAALPPPEPGLAPLGIGFRSLTFARDALGSDWWRPLVLEARDSCDEEGDCGRGAYPPGSLTVLLSAGHWNLRFDGQPDNKNLSSPVDILANYYAEVRALMANATSGAATAPGVRDRLMWRSTLPVDIGNPRFVEGAFNAGNVTATNAVVSAAWATAGFAVFDAFKYGNVSVFGKANHVRNDGIHYTPWANAAMARELMSAVYERVARAAAVPAPPAPPSASGTAAATGSPTPPLPTPSASASASTSAPATPAASTSGSASLPPSPTTSAAASPTPQPPAPTPTPQLPAAPLPSSSPMNSPPQKLQEHTDTPTKHTDQQQHPLADGGGRDDHHHSLPLPPAPPPTVAVAGPAFPIASFVALAAAFAAGFAVRWACAAAALCGATAKAPASTPPPLAMSGASPDIVASSAPARHSRAHKAGTHSAPAAGPLPGAAGGSDDDTSDNKNRERGSRTIAPHTLAADVEDDDEEDDDHDDTTPLRLQRAP